MTDVNEAVDLAQADLPDIPFNHASLEGREVEYIQEAVRSGHASIRRSLHGAGTAAAARRARRARKRCC